MMRYCDICRCIHEEEILTRIGILHMKGSEDDYICPRCRTEIVHFACSLRAVADKVRFEKIDHKKG